MNSFFKGATSVSLLFSCMTRPERRFVILVATLLVLDRLAKVSAVLLWSRSSLDLLPNVRLGFLLNKGFVFSAPSNISFLVVGTVLALAAFVLWFVVCVRKNRIYESLGIGAILAAAMSNGLDRLQYGGVVDYVQVGFPMLFNLADVVIVLSILWLARRPQV